MINRPADKGSGIVVMDTNKYVDQLESEIINSASYNEVKEDRSKQITNKIEKLVNSMYKKDPSRLSYDIMFKWNIYIYWY